MFEPFNEYRDKSPYEKKLYRSKVILIATASLLFIGVIVYGLVSWR